ncbi:MAG: hypothetical protein NVS1B4_21880 [Gemmatimonadaceae bacterium]
MWFRRKKAHPDPQDVARLLRMQALEVAPGVPSADHPHVWAILMETGMSGSVVTLVTMADGSTSLYFSTGGGVIGAGEHESVRAALGPFFAEAERQLDAFEVSQETPLPDQGRVRFYVRTVGCTVTADASEADLAGDRHTLSPLFHAGHGVIAAVRAATGR